MELAMTAREKFEARLKELGLGIELAVNLLNF